MGSRSEASQPALPTNAMRNAAPEVLEYTGERMVPEKCDARTFWQHVYRYRFATKFVKGRRVLDIACGEGYGTAALERAGATGVIGIDLSDYACQHAHGKYGVKVLTGDAMHIPLVSKSVDVVVSFETIEHVAQPKLFLEECVRVLVPGGVLIVSTPNRDVYRNEMGRKNEFHHTEFSEEEFACLLRQYFPRTRFYTQQPTASSWWSMRPLVLATSPWLRVKGFWRLRNMLVRQTCPHIFDASEEDRRTPIESVLAKENLLSILVNPHRVARQLLSSHEQPEMIVAVVRV